MTCTEKSTVVSGQIITLDQLQFFCGYKTDMDSDRQQYSYSCSHPENPDRCEEYDGQCTSDSCPIADCIDDPEDATCPYYEGDRRMILRQAAKGE